MKFKAGIPLLLAATLLAAEANAQTAAPDRGFYLGGSVGQSQTDIDTASLNRDIVGLGFTSATTSGDDEDTAWRLFAGYQFNRNGALELGYTDLGKFSVSSVTTGPAVNFNGEIKAKIWSLDAVGIVPLGERFALFGKLGATYWDVNSGFNAAGPGGTARIAEGDDGFGWKFGLGGRYDFTRNFGVRLEWERYYDVGNEDTTGKEDADYISVGLQFKF